MFTFFGGAFCSSGVLVLVGVEAVLTGNICPVHVLILGYTVLLSIEGFSGLSTQIQVAGQIFVAILIMFTLEYIRLIVVGKGFAQLIQKRHLLHQLNLCTVSSHYQLFQGPF